MKLADPKKLHTLEVPGQDELPEAERRRYHLLVPTVYSRSDWQFDLEVKGVRIVHEGEIIKALHEGIDHLVRGEDAAEARANLHGVVDDYAEKMKAAELAEAIEIWLDAAADINIVRSLVADGGFEPYNRLVALRNRYWRDMPAEACRHFLAGWENGPAPWPGRGPDGFPRDQLGLIPEAERALIGQTILGLISPSQGEAKNSDSSSPGQPTAATSTSAARASSTRQTTPGRKAKAGPSQRSAGAL